MKSININEMNMNPFTMIGKEWCLIGAKHGDAFNAMTASWGGVGVLWNKNVVSIYVRPQRYTKQFIDAQDYFTLSFFKGEYKKELGFYGSTSGRTVDKEKESGLTRCDDGEYAYFEEASVVFECRKIYEGLIRKEEMLDASIDENYPESDYHQVYIAEIMNVLKK